MNTEKTLWLVIWIAIFCIVVILAYTLLDKANNKSERESLCNEIGGEHYTESGLGTNIYFCLVEENGRLGGTQMIKVEGEWRFLENLRRR